jgi:cytochrome c nitrite reductase small subunit
MTLRPGRATFLRFAAAGLFGIAAGLGAFTFVYARGYSYLGHDSAACANCHVMREQYAGWVKGSHRSAAGCNDCHTPGNALGKYATKASNGFWHSFYFTTGSFPEPIRIRPRNRAVTERRCRDCHADVTSQIAAADHGDGLSCITCHRHVGHL